ncbi:mechanosensitive channel protein, partial [Erwinia amylovora]|nr:mechanosensitive channel protein [Erwinia amylovora]
ALYLIFHNRQHIHQELSRVADRSMSFFALFIRAFALVWHWLDSAYFVTLFLFSIFKRGIRLIFMMSARVLSLALIVILELISGVIKRWIHKNIVIYPELRS